jgi:site-specific DNA-methyltransferase (adenine-specific)
MEYLIKSYSNEKDIIVDPFAGSGSTGVAAIKAGRTFIGIEQDEEYFAVACERMKQAYAESKTT